MYDTLNVSYFSGVAASSDCIGTGNGAIICGMLGVVRVAGYKKWRKVFDKSRAVACTRERGGIWHGLNIF